MKINTSRNTAKDSFYSLVPINWLLRSTGLSYTYRKGIYPSTSASILKSVIHIIIFGLLNVFCLYFKLETFRLNTRTGIVKFSNIIQITYLNAYFIYVIDVYLVCKQNGDYSLRYFRTYDRIDSILGFMDFDKIRKTIIDSIVLSITICGCISSFDYTCWVLFEGWKYPTIYSVDYVYSFLNLFTILDVISHVTQVEYRLKMIADLLQASDLLENTHISFIKPIINVEEYDSVSKNISTTKPLDSSFCSETTWFTRCYLLLLDQVTYVNNRYGLRVMVHCVNVLLNMTHLFNLGIRMITGTIADVYADAIAWFSSPLITVLPAVSSVIRALNYEFMVIILAYRCEQTYKQSDSILETIDILLASNKNRSTLKANLLEFRNLVITRPIKFHAAKFFTMDYTLLVSLNSAVVTYTIIMLQNIQ